MRVLFLRAERHCPEFRIDSTANLQKQTDNWRSVCQLLVKMEPYRVNVVSLLVVINRLVQNVVPSVVQSTRRSDALQQHLKDFVVTVSRRQMHRCVLQAQRESSGDNFPVFLNDPEHCVSV